MSAKPYAVAIWLSRAPQTAQGQNGATLEVFQSLEVALQRYHELYEERARKSYTLLSMQINQLPQHHLCFTDVLGLQQQRLVAPVPITLAEFRVIHPSVKTPV
jgi:hypothetical protein